jgi:putative sigma-54 modulation protein
MIVEIKLRGMEPDVKVTKYIHKKIGGLEKFVPKVQRKVAVISVFLEEDPNGREQNRFVCEAIISLVGTKLVAKDSTVNIYAAIDIVEAKLKTQLTDYKEKSSPRQSRLRIMNRWRERRRNLRLERLVDEEAATEE